MWRRHANIVSFGYHLLVKLGSCNKVLQMQSSRAILQQRFCVMYEVRSAWISCVVINFKAVKGINIEQVTYERINSGVMIMARSGIQAGWHQKLCDGELKLPMMRATIQLADTKTAKSSKKGVLRCPKTGLAWLGGIT